MEISPDLKTIGAGLAMMGTLGPGIGVGLVGAKVLEGIARQPEISNNLFTLGIVFAALCEAMGLLACIIGFKLCGIF